MQVISDSTPIARKDHRCDACDWLINAGVTDLGLSFGEYREVVKAKRNGWKIKKGQRYFKQVNIYDGEFGVFKGIPAITEICQKYDLFREH